MLKKSIDPKAEYHELSDEYKKRPFGISLLSVDEPPYPIGGMKSFMSKLRYTEEARKYGIEGRLLIQAEIDEHGIVKNTKPISKLGYGLDEIAEEAIKDTKFKPAMKSGKPVCSTARFPIIFKLKD